MSINKNLKDVFSTPVAKAKIRTSTQVQEVKDSLDISVLNLEELLQLRAKIDERLPAKSLKDMDLEKEAVIQYLTLKTLQEKTLGEDGTAANQKAQVANATASALQALDKMQRETFSFERFKEVENSLVAMLEEWPEDMTRKFFEEYERRLNVK